MINEKATALLRILSPHFLSSDCHKILEYMIRVFEIHVYLKREIAFLFLPFFETSYFTRLIQLLNLKEDPSLYFLNDYAYKGIKVDKKTLVKYLSKQGALGLKSFAEYAISVSETHRKFFCFILVEVKHDHNSLMNLLPFIQEGLRTMRAGCLMAICEICLHKTLTLEYTEAFIQEIVQTMEFDFS